MHRYAIEDHKSDKPLHWWLIAIFVISMGASWLIGYFFGIAPYLGKAEVPSAFAIFALLYSGFDRYAWRWPVINRFLPIPNLNGKWPAKIQPDASDTAIEADLAIYQTFTTISININTPISRSDSIAASIEILNPNELIIRNQYRASPIGGSGLEPHEGTNKIVLSISDHRNILPKDGSYYTESKRNTQGAIFFG